MNNKAGFIVSILLVLGLIGTYIYTKTKPSKPEVILPHYGIDDVVTKNVDGKQVLDTIYHQIPDFKFTSQEGKTVTMANMKNCIFVADFFFTTCPSICKDMAIQKMRIYKTFANHPNVKMISHTVNPHHDTVQTLMAYAKRCKITDHDKWYLVTGSKPALYEQARKGYMVTATEGDGGEDDFVHTEKFALIDKHHHIRGFYDGTSEQEVNQLMYDMDQLLKEE